MILYKFTYNNLYQKDMNWLEAPADLKMRKFSVTVRGLVQWGIKSTTLDCRLDVLKYEKVSV